VNPNLLKEASELDRLRRDGTVLLLHCIPLAVKV